MKAIYKKYRDLNWEEKRDRKEKVIDIAVFFWAFVWVASSIALLIIEHSKNPC